MSTTTLLNTIIEGIQEKKGKDVITIDLKKLDSSICDYFIICHGDSNTQVNAIADSIEAEVKKTLGIRVDHREGKANAEWIVLDYFHVIVHVFQAGIREHYNIEELYSDAKSKRIAEPKSLLKKTDSNDRAKKPSTSRAKSAGTKKTRSTGKAATGKTAEKPKPVRKTAGKRK